MADDDLIDPLKAAQQGAAGGGEDDGAAMFAEFAKAKDTGTALPPEPEEANKVRVDGGKPAAELEPNKAETEQGAAKAAPEEKTNPAKGAEPGADDADDPKALRAALAAAQADVQKLARDFHAYKSQEGRRLAALQGKNVPGVDVPKTTADEGAAPAKTEAAPKKDDDDPLASPEFLKVKEEYGDVIAPLEKVIKHLSGKLKEVEGRTERHERDLSGLTTAQTNEYVAEQSAALTAKHNDWVSIVQSDDFEGWLNDQPEEIQALVKKNAARIVDAKAGARALDLYKSDRGIGGKPAKVEDNTKVDDKTTEVTKTGSQGANRPADRRQRQLEGNTSIKDKGPGPAGGPSSDDETALFRHFAAQKDKEMGLSR